MGLSDRAQEFALSCIGLIPWVGGIAKDQFKFTEQEMKDRRIESTIDRIRIRIERMSDKIKASINSVDAAEIVALALERAQSEQSEQKRRMIADFACNAAVRQFSNDQSDWFYTTLSSLSTMAINVLLELSKENPMHRQQFHSHTGVLEKLESQLGYAMLLANIKSLANVGLLELRVDHSSVAGGNHRYTLWYNESSNQFIDFAKGD